MYGNRKENRKRNKKEGYIYIYVCVKDGYRERT